MCVYVCMNVYVRIGDRVRLFCACFETKVHVCLWTHERMSFSSFPRRLGSRLPVDMRDMTYTYIYTCVCDFVFPSVLHIDTVIEVYAQKYKCTLIYLCISFCITSWYSAQYCVFCWYKFSRYKADIKMHKAEIRFIDNRYQYINTYEYIGRYGLIHRHRYLNRCKSEAIPPPPSLKK